MEIPEKIEYDDLFGDFPSDQTDDHSPVISWVKRLLRIDAVKPGESDED